MIFSEREIASIHSGLISYHCAASDNPPYRAYHTLSFGRHAPSTLVQYDNRLTITFGLGYRGTSINASLDIFPVPYFGIEQTVKKIRLRIF